jgi:hypothetical protein
LKDDPARVKALFTHFREIKNKLIPPSPYFTHSGLLSHGGEKNILMCKNCTKGFNEIQYKMRKANNAF